MDKQILIKKKNLSKFEQNILVYYKNITHKKYRTYQHFFQINRKIYNRQKE